jgi:hypothetical protein
MTGRLMKMAEKCIRSPLRIDVSRRAGRLTLADSRIAALPEDCFTRGLVIVTRAPGSTAAGRRQHT